MAVTPPSLPPSLLAASRPASTIDTPSFVPAPSLGQPSGVPTSKIQASGERNLRGSSAQNPGTSETAVSDQSKAPGSATPPKITGPELLKMERPALTPALRAMIKPGFTVAVTVRIDANGKVVGVRQEGQQSGGVAYAVSHAVAAVHRWRFKPATRNGVPIQSEATVHLKF
jgi:protein TonB